MTDWYEQHAQRYDRLERGLEGDVAFYVRLACAAPPPVLEVGCGTGRVTVAVAGAGVPVVGLDRSPAMLAVARRKAGPLPGLRWMMGDVRDLDAPERFGLVFIPHRTFQHLLTPDDQRATLARIHRHLVPGGRLALNITNPAIIKPAAAASRGARVPPQLRGTGTAAGTDESPPSPAAFIHPHRNLRLRQVTPEEMRRRLDDSGFTVEAHLGWFDGRPFAPDSPEQVWVART